MTCADWKIINAPATTLSCLPAIIDDVFSRKERTGNDVIYTAPPKIAVGKPKSKSAVMN